MYNQGGRGNGMGFFGGPIPSAQQLSMVAVGMGAGLTSGIPMVGALRMNQNQFQAVSNLMSLELTPASLTGANLLTGVPPMNSLNLQVQQNMMNNNMVQNPAAMQASVGHEYMQHFMPSVEFSQAQVTAVPYTSTVSYNQDIFNPQSMNGFISRASTSGSNKLSWKGLSEEGQMSMTSMNQQLNVGENRMMNDNTTLSASTNQTMLDQYLHNGSNTVTKSPDVASKYLYCDLCDVNFSNQKQYSVHLSGFMHTRCVKRLKAKGLKRPEHVTTLSNTPQTLKVSSTLDAQSKILKANLLSMLKAKLEAENNARKDIAESFYCKLCSLQLSEETWMAHASTLAHSMRYLEFHLKLGDDKFLDKFGDVIWNLEEPQCRDRGTLPPVVALQQRIGDFEPLMMYRSGHINKFHCRICASKCYLNLNWLSHVQGKKHKQRCDELVRQMGINDFMHKYWPIPGPHWVVIAKAGAHDMFKLDVPEYLQMEQPVSRTVPEVKSESTTSVSMSQLVYTQPLKPALKKPINQLLGNSSEFYKQRKDPVSDYSSSVNQKLSVAAQVFEYGHSKVADTSFDGTTQTSSSINAMYNPSSPTQDIFAPAASAPISSFAQPISVSKPVNIPKTSTYIPGSKAFGNTLLSLGMKGLSNSLSSSYETSSTSARDLMTTVSSSSVKQQVIPVGPPLSSPMVQAPLQKPRGIPGIDAYNDAEVDKSRLADKPASDLADKPASDQIDNLDAEYVDDLDHGETKKQPNDEAEKLFWEMMKEKEKRDDNKNIKVIEEKLFHLRTVISEAEKKLSLEDEKLRRDEERYLEKRKQIVDEWEKDRIYDDVDYEPDRRRDDVDYEPNRRRDDVDYEPDRRRYDVDYEPDRRRDDVDYEPDRRRDDEYEQISTRDRRRRETSAEGHKEKYDDRYSKHHSSRDYDNKRHSHSSDLHCDMYSEKDRRYAKYSEGDRQKTNYSKRTREDDIDYDRQSLKYAEDLLINKVEVNVSSGDRKVYCKEDSLVISSSGKRQTESCVDDDAYSYVSDDPRGPDEGYSDISEDEHMLAGKGSRKRDKRRRSTTSHRYNSDDMKIDNIDSGKHTSDKKYDASEYQSNSLKYDDDYGHRHHSTLTRRHRTKSRDRSSLSRVRYQRSRSRSHGRSPKVYASSHDGTGHVRSISRDRHQHSESRSQGRSHVYASSHDKADHVRSVSRDRHQHAESSRDKQSYLCTSGDDIIRDFSYRNRSGHVRSASRERNDKSQHRSRYHRSASKDYSLPCRSSRHDRYERSRNSPNEGYRRSSGNRSEHEPEQSQSSRNDLFHQKLHKPIDDVTVKDGQYSRYQLRSAEPSTRIHCGDIKSSRYDATAHSHDHPSYPGETGVSHYNDPIKQIPVIIPSGDQRRLELYSSETNVPQTMYETPDYNSVSASRSKPNTYLEALVPNVPRLGSQVHRDANKSIVVLAGRTAKEPVKKADTGKNTPRSNIVTIECKNDLQIQPVTDNDNSNKPEKESLSQTDTPVNMTDTVSIQSTIHSLRMSSALIMESKTKDSTSNITLVNVDKNSVQLGNSQNQETSSCVNNNSEQSVASKIINMEDKSTLSTKIQSIEKSGTVSPTVVQNAPVLDSIICRTSPHSTSVVMTTSANNTVNTLGIEAKSTTFKDSVTTSETKTTTCTAVSSSVLENPSHILEHEAGKKDTSSNKKSQIEAKSKTIQTVTIHPMKPSSATSDQIVSPINSVLALHPTQLKKKNAQRTLISVKLAFQDDKKKRATEEKLKASKLESETDKKPADIITSDATTVVKSTSTTIPDAKGSVQPCGVPLPVSELAYLTRPSIGRSSSTSVTCSDTLSISKPTKQILSTTISQPVEALCKVNPTIEKLPITKLSAPTINVEVPSVTKSTTLTVQSSVTTGAMTSTSANPSPFSKPSSFSQQSKNSSQSTAVAIPPKSTPQNKGKDCTVKHKPKKTTWVKNEPCSSIQKPSKLNEGPKADLLSGEVDIFSSEADMFNSDCESQKKHNASKALTRKTEDLRNILRRNRNDPTLHDRDLRFELQRDKDMRLNRNIHADTDLKVSLDFTVHRRIVEEDPSSRKSGSWDQLYEQSDSFRDDRLSARYKHDKRVDQYSEASRKRTFAASHDDHLEWHDNESSKQPRFDADLKFGTSDLDLRVTSTRGELPPAFVEGIPRNSRHEEPIQFHDEDFREKHADQDYRIQQPIEPKPDSRYSSRQSQWQSLNQDERYHPNKDNQRYSAEVRDDKRYDDSHDYHHSKNSGYMDEDWRQSDTLVVGAEPPQLQMVEALDIFKSSLTEFLHRLQGTTETGYEHYRSQREILDSLHPEERDQVLCIQQLTNMDDIGRIATALRALMIMDPRVVETLGSMDQEALAQLTSDNQMAPEQRQMFYMMFSQSEHHNQQRFDDSARGRFDYRNKHRSERDWFAEPNVDREFHDFPEEKHVQSNKDLNSLLDHSHNEHTYGHSDRERDSWNQSTEYTNHHNIMHSSGRRNFFRRGFFRMPDHSNH